MLPGPNSELSLMAAVCERLKIHHRVTYETSVPGYSGVLDVFLVMPGATAPAWKRVQGLIELVHVLSEHLRG